MERTRLLVDQQKMYALSQNEDGRYFIEVVVGGFTMEELVIPLSSEELSQYQSRGKVALDELSHRICKETTAYRKRAV